MNRYREHGPEDAHRALVARAWPGKGNETKGAGPCPICGGTDRFHYGPGTKGRKLLMGCRRNGCAFAELCAELFPRETRLRPSGTPEWHKDPKTAKRTPRAAGGESRALGANPQGTGNGESPLTRETVPPKGKGTPDYGAWAAERLEGTLTLGPKASDWLNARGLSPELAAARGFRSAETREELNAVDPRPYGGRWPGLPPNLLPALFAIVTTLDGAPLGARVRSLAGGPWLTMTGDAARPGFADTCGFGTGPVHITEGETDALALLAARPGARVLALPGASSCHPAAVALLKAVEAPWAVLWLDGDPSGREQAAVLAGKLSAAGIQTRTWDFSDGLDVNEALQADPRALAEAVRAMEKDHA